MSPADRDARRTYQVTVAGSLGPALRTAFEGFEVETVEACTTLEVNGHADRDLLDVIAVLAAARLTVLEASVVPTSPGATAEGLSDLVHNDPVSASPATGESTCATRVGVGSTATTG